LGYKKNVMSFVLARKERIGVYLDKWKIPTHNILYNA
jgi:hypothetical protein